MPTFSDDGIHIECDDSHPAISVVQELIVRLNNGDFARPAKAVNGVKTKVKPSARVIRERRHQSEMVVQANKLYPATGENHDKVLHALASKGSISKERLMESLGEDTDTAKLRGVLAGLSKVCKGLGIQYPIIKRDGRYSLEPMFAEAWNILSRE